MDLQPRKAIRSSSVGFEPVTAAEAKKELEISGSDHDTHLNSLITEARQSFEYDSNVVIATGSYTLTLDSWPCDDIELPIRPVTSITSITYVDTAGVSQTLSASAYTLDNYRAMPRVVLTYGNSWPTQRGWTNDITVTFVAGYASASTVPQDIKTRVLLEVARRFSDRLDELGESLAQVNLSRRYARQTYP